MVAFLFPGQGSHAPRMGEGLLAASWAAELVGRAEEKAGLPLAEIILQRPEGLSRTAAAQPAILLVEWLAFEALKRKGKAPRAVAGHSLGEFAALAACGAIPWEEALGLAALRGRLMEEAAAVHPGGMLAALKLPASRVEEIARDAGCVVANYNSPLQTVLSGSTAALERARKLIEAAGGRAIPLAVAGPFHSPAMAEAEEELAPRIEELGIRSPRCTFISSVSGRPEEDPTRIKSLLLKQMTSPVRWTATLEALAELGVEEAWEVGPGEVLTRLGNRSGVGIRFLALREVMGHV